MARWPCEGAVKTRLAEAIGASRALAVYEALLHNVTARCLPDMNDTYCMSGFIDPPARLSDFQVSFPGYDGYFPQSPGNLGDRLFSALKELLERQHAKRALLIGADIPKLDRLVIIEAFSRLDTCDVVFGPTQDGGYYLIGMNRTYQPLFENVEWGTSNVITTSLGRAEDIGLSVQLLPKLNDLDTLDDMRLFPEIMESAGIMPDQLPGESSIAT